MEREYVPSWSRSIFLTSLGAAVFGAFYLANDTFVMHNIILCPEDSFTAVSFYLIIGGWIGTFCMLVYNSIFGRLIDADYPGFNLGTTRMQIFALISGVIAATSTTFCLFGSQKFDPSLVIAFSSVSVFYLGLYDSIRGYVKINSIALPMLFIIGGSILASILRLSGGFKITLLGVLILLVGRCGTDAIEKIIRQKGVWESDAITFNFWRFFWLSVSGTLLMIGIVLFRGKLNQLIGMQKMFFPALPWILVTMLFVFVHNSLLQKAMKTGAVSKISLVVNFQIVLGVPMALIGNTLHSELFGTLPRDPLVWMVRSIGVILITLGVVQLRSRKSRQ